MQVAATCRLPASTAGRPACEPASRRRREHPAAAARLHRAAAARQPHDGAATREVQTEELQQQWQHAEADGLQLNNAVEHNRRGKRQPPPTLPPLVERLLSSPSLERPDGTDPRQFLRVMEAFWAAQKQAYADPAAAPKAPTVVQRLPGSCGRAEFDAAVAGGTLGILLALALQARGHRVAVIERRRLEGRSQEWNISRAELANLVDCGLLTSAELSSCVVSSWDSVQVSFHGSEPVNCGGGILDCGVSPRRLLAVLRRRFVEAGGTILEQHTFKAASVFDDGVTIQLLPSTIGAAAIELGDVNRPMALQHDQHAAAGSSSNGAPPRRREVTARLLVDCMGHFSPIVKQMRAGQQPDGMLLVVGGCWAGMPPEANCTTDLLATVTDAEDDLQLFWEAFPAADGRTVYMFTYTDADPSRPSFAELLDKYCSLLPTYQGVTLEQTAPLRMLMGGFPCYGRAPLRPGWDRVLQIGDAGAGQSPLSFGGFGSMVRHLPRLVTGVSEALQEDRLSQADLSLLAPYQPSLSTAWLLQRAMAVRPGELRATPSAPQQQGQVAAQQQAAQQLAQHGEQQTAQQQADQQQQAGQQQQQQQRQPGGGWLPPNQINRLLRCNFAVLRALGSWVLRPFLTDTFQALPLALTMVGMSLRDPVCVLRSMRQVGPGLVLSWVRHFLALSLFTMAHAVLQPLVRALPMLRRSWRVRRLLDALRWGAGLDYRHASASDTASNPAAAPAAAAPAAAAT